MHTIFFERLEPMLHADNMETAEPLLRRMQVVETHVQPVADLLLPSQEGSRVPSSPKLACAPNAFPFFRVFRAGPTCW